MTLPIRYPWRRPYGAWLLTTVGLLAVLLPASVWVERLWGIALPSYGIETIVAMSMLMGLVAACIAFQRQEAAGPDDSDDPS